MLSAGVLIAGKYRVIKKLGEGAMGSVWLAKNEVTDREFAIKVLLPQAADSPTALARFLREARICGALRHPSILEIYDAGEAPELGGVPFLVMERLEGAALDVVIRQVGALPPRLALDIVVQISRGLHLAHQKGIVHRDLKPANVFLHGPGTGAIEPKVLDFGISKIIDATTPQIALTNTSAILGSPIYMSPEQMGVGTAFDARSDVHALGILLWECLTGRPPFSSTSYHLLVVEIIQGPRPKLRDAMPTASNELAAIVERAFAIDVKLRYATAGELADALEVELARLGGGVLGARTAVVDVLGKLNLESKPPPRMHASTTEPISLDPLKVSPAAKSIVGTLLSQGSAVPASSARSAPASFAETEVAPGTPSVPRDAPASAVSAERDLPTPRGSGASSSRAKIAGVALAAAIAIAAVVFAMRRAPKPADAVNAEPRPSVSAVAVAPTAVVAASAPPVSATPIASASPSASASAAPPSAAHVPAASTSPGASPARRPPRPPPAASASTSRPRIDQSGL